MRCTVRSKVTSTMDDAAIKPLVYQEKEIPTREIQDMINSAFQVVWPKDLSKHAQSVQAILSTSTTPINSKYLEGFPAVKIVSNFGVGYDHINVKECRSCGARVGNTAGTLNDTTADIAFALLLSAARLVVKGDGISKNEMTTKLRNDFLGYQVSGKTIGIIGMGRIGKEIAKRAHGFSMPVLYHNRNQLTSETEECFKATYVSMEDLLIASDFIVVAIPGSKENRNLIGEEEFSKMKPTSVFVNVGRGSVIDQTALIHALTNGVIASAGLDVTDPEPLPRDHPLLTAPNVIITPHVGMCKMSMHSVY